MSPYKRPPKGAKRMNTITRRLSAETILPDTLKGFLSFVEIKTKVTSVFPFLLGLAYLISSGYEVDFFKTAVLFGECFLRSYRNRGKQLFRYKEKPAGAPIFLRTARPVVIVVCSEHLLGIVLVLTDVIVLFLGALAFFRHYVFMRSRSYLPRAYGEIVSGFLRAAHSGYPFIYKYSGKRAFTYFITEGNSPCFLISDLCSAFCCYLFCPFVLPLISCLQTIYVISK